MSFGAGRTTQLATADRIEVRLENPPPTELTYEIQARRGPEGFRPDPRPAPHQRHAAGADTNFGQPIDRLQIHEPIVIEGVVRETLIVGVVPTALVWLPTQGAPAGMEDESGRFLLVNGTAVACRRGGRPCCRSCSGFGMRRSNCSGPARSATVRTMPNAFRRIIQKIPMANLTSMIVKNRARADPSRPGDHFDPPRTIDPIMPLRSRPCSNRTGP